jgi:hypothetical protein
MISVLLETGSSRPSTGSMVAVASMLGYAFLASIVAGAASPGAGLGVLALGLFAATVADFAMWREIAAREARTVDAVPDEERLALPAPQRNATIVEARQEAVPA